MLFYRLPPPIFAILVSGERSDSILSMEMSLCPSSSGIYRSVCRCLETLLLIKFSVRAWSPPKLSVHFVLLVAAITFRYTFYQLPSRIWRFWCRGNLLTLPLHQLNRRSALLLTQLPSVLRLLARWCWGRWGYSGPLS